MKTAHDPRHIKRREIVKALFAETFTHQDQIASTNADEESDFSDVELTDTDKEEILCEVGLVLGKQTVIDQLIQKAATEWPIEKLNKIDLSILRLSIYELLEKSDSVPPKVAIDEAVELSKEFGSETTSSFVNGVLGTVLKEIEDGKK